MKHYERDLVLPRSIQSSFEYVSDFRHTVSWDPRVSRALRTRGEGPLAVGTEFVLESPFPLLGPLSLPYRIVSFEPPHQVVFEGEAKIGRYRDQLTFRAVDESTTALHYQASFWLPGWLAWFGPVFGPFFQKIGDDATENIGRAVAEHVPAAAEDPQSGSGS